MPTPNSFQFRAVPIRPHTQAKHAGNIPSLICTPHLVLKLHFLQNPSTLPIPHLQQLATLCKLSHLGVTEHPDLIWLPWKRASLIRNGKLVSINGLKVQNNMPEVSFLFTNAEVTMQVWNLVTNVDRVVGTQPFSAGAVMAPWEYLAHLKAEDYIYCTWFYVYLFRLYPSLTGAPWNLRRAPKRLELKDGLRIAVLE